MQSTNKYVCQSNTTSKFELGLFVHVQVYTAMFAHDHFAYEY